MKHYISPERELNTLMFIFGGAAFILTAGVIGVLATSLVWLLQ